MEQALTRGGFNSLIDWTDLIEWLVFEGGDSVVIPEIS